VPFSDKRFEAEGFGRSYSWIDFVNSEEYNGFGVRSDHLLDPTWIKAFFRRWSVGSSFGEQTNIRDLTRTRDLLRIVAETIAAGKRLSTPNFRTVNEALRTPVYRRLILNRGGSYALEILPLRGGWKWAQAELFRSLGTMLSEGQQHRLKICPNSGCRWLFFDQTRGNTRKWCSDLTCGNRDKVRRHRARIGKSRGA
jgi:CGNR zinc finger/Putative stress-induced transcription regulator